LILLPFRCFPDLPEDASFCPVLPLSAGQKLDKNGPVTTWPCSKVASRRRYVLLHMHVTHNGPQIGMAQDRHQRSAIPRSTARVAKVPQIAT
jgi:hypothetical protein